MKIHCKDDCGNAPKKKVLLELTVAMARADLPVVSDILADNIIMDVAGKKQLRGMEEIASLLQNRQKEPVAQLHIHHIITHGNIGSANGTAVWENGKKIHFCAVCLFNSFKKDAKIKEMTLYVVIEAS